jgi:molybdate transport system substrate-binding protein
VALACVALACVALAAACGRSKPAEPLLVFAASDLRYALADVAGRYRASGGDSAVLVFGSTGDLATQIANGAPADLFFAANAEAVDDLARRHLVVDSTRAVYAIGKLALVARCAKDSVPNAPRCPTLALGDLATPAVKVVAIADPTHAPYGKAAQQALERAGLLDRVHPKLVLGANITQAYQFVETGNADAGLVALSLALRTPGRTYALVDTALYDPMRQTLAVPTTSAHPAAAVRFLRYVRADSGQAVLRRYGFAPPS